MIERYVKVGDYFTPITDVITIQKGRATFKSTKMNRYIFHHIGDTFELLSIKNEVVHYIKGKISQVDFGRPKTSFQIEVTWEDGQCESSTALRDGEI